MLTSQHAFRFFLEHAGYVKGQHALSAYHLAKAETLAKWRNWTVSWRGDDDPDLGEHDFWCDEERAGRRHSHEVLGAVLLDSSGEVLASLWSIIDPSTAYCRVVEAELAADALADEGRRIAADRDSARYMAL